MFCTDVYIINYLCVQFENTYIYFAYVYKYWKNLSEIEIYRHLWIKIIPTSNI